MPCSCGVDAVGKSKVSGRWGAPQSILATRTRTYLCKELPRSARKQTVEYER